MESTHFFSVIECVWVFSSVIVLVSTRLRHIDSEGKTHLPLLWTELAAKGLAWVTVEVTWVELYATPGGTSSFV